MITYIIISAQAGEELLKIKSAKQLMINLDDIQKTLSDALRDTSKELNYLSKFLEELADDLSTTDEE